MRMQLSLKITLSEDSDQLVKNLDLTKVVDDTLVTSWDGGVITLAAGATNQPVLFPKVAAGKYLLIIVWSGEITYRVNNVASQALAVEVNPATTPDPILPYQKEAQPGLVFSGPMSATAPLTSLFLSNPGLTSARVQVAIVGEAA